MTENAETILWWLAAAGCLLLAHLLQPWRQATAAGRSVFTENHRLWLVPALVSCVDALLNGWLDHGTHASADFGVNALRTGDELARTLGLVLLPGLSAAGAALVCLVNGAGTAGGFRRGLEAVFPKAGTTIWAMSLVSAGCSVWHLGLLISGKVEPLATLLHTMASLWSGVCGAALMAWVFLYAETHLRQPERVARVEWPVSVAAYTARLWPWITAGTVISVAGRHIPAEAWWWRSIAWPAAITFSCGGLVLLHLKHARRFTAGLGMTVERLMTAMAPLILWLALTAAWFFLVHRAFGALGQWLGPHPALDAWESFVLTALAVSRLAAWIACQVAIFPPVMDGKRVKKS